MKTKTSAPRKLGRPKSPARTEFGHWMDRNDITAAVLAAVGDCSIQSVNAIRRGLQKPSLSVARRFIIFSRQQDDPIDVCSFFPKK